MCSALLYMQLEHRVFCAETAEAIFAKINNGSKITIKYRLVQSIFYC